MNCVPSTAGGPYGPRRTKTIDHLPGVFIIRCDMRHNFVHVIFGKSHISGWCARGDATTGRCRAHAAGGRIVIMLTTRILVHVNILLRWLLHTLNWYICISIFLGQTGRLTLWTRTASRKYAATENEKKKNATVNNIQYKSFCRFFFFNYREQKEQQQHNINKCLCRPFCTTIFTKYHK